MGEGTKLAVSTTVQLACSAGIPLAVYTWAKDKLPEAGDALPVVALTCLLGGMGIGAALHAWWAHSMSKRLVFRQLNEREKWCIAQVMDVYPGRFAATVGHPTIPDLDRLAEFGILVSAGTVELGGCENAIYAPTVEWRKWLSRHLDKLPKPKSPMPHGAY